MGGGQGAPGAGLPGSFPVGARPSAAVHPGSLDRRRSPRDRPGRLGARRREGRGPRTPAPGEGRVMSRAGFVAVIGAPNAGKSTLVNRLVGSKVSIVTRK